MLDLGIDPRARRLTSAEKAHYAERGYVKNLPVFAPEAVATLQARFRAFAARLEPGVDINRVNMWHKASAWFHALCRTPAILDYVEDILGPDFYQWGGQFFVKYPGDGSIVPWHQDAQYWPLTPRRTVTVWLAIHDADEANAAMQVVAGSHREGMFRHRTNDDPNYVLAQEVDASAIRREDVVTMDLRAGEISLHDDGLLHGSGANRSDRLRCGLTMRFSPTEVKADLAVWPTFESYMARGVDRFRHNPEGRVPTGEGAPSRKFQHSREFV
jgi:ectoine hydroxylase-related dioxygenase (phytanoyl-CoA dioxygenase family)